MKLKFVGTNECAAFALEDYCNKHGIKFSATGPVNDIRHAADELIETAEDIVVFDLGVFDNTEEEIVSSIGKLQTAINCDIMIFCPGFDEESKVITSIKALGIGKFIYNEKNIGKLQIDIAECMTTARETPSEEQEKIIANREETKAGIMGTNEKMKNIFSFPESAQSKINQNERKIAVVGCMERIGCTRIALQLVKYLNLKEEESACYIQSNGNFVENLEGFYFCRVDETDGSVLFKNTRMYPDSSRMASMRAKGYTNFIYDYGAFKKKDESSILERDIIIVVGGTGPSEMTMYEDIVKATYDNPVTNFVICNCGDADKEELLSLMEKKRNKTYFFDYDSRQHADPFIFDPANTSMFEEILKTKMPEASDIDKRKNKKMKRLFGR